MEREGFICFYPLYLDSEQTHTSGRKYSKENCVAGPKYTEIKQALDKMKVEYISEPAKANPRNQSILGRFLIKKGETKKNLAIKIVEIIREIRLNRSLSTKTTNSMNLVPIKKKKGKKHK